MRENEKIKTYMGKDDTIGAVDVEWLSLGRGRGSGSRIADYVVIVMQGKLSEYEYKCELA